ncbi:hypothetical protein ERICIV_02863 [Paenibacillus larvae subsp. larvae]|uniref:Regulatory protein YlbF n=4 Tax=Paenibacillus larvae TaxID=1464 RepID=A0A2L1U242_9BACL|nr:hypothetical protein ERICIII_02872 [Paenibacillus larvae subsp. larvae]AVF31752.1 hypothetical protein ERICIV_02863 [Paenibacillus larvae subsp. larvae]
MVSATTFFVFYTVYLTGVSSLIGRGEAFFFKEVVFCILSNVWYNRGYKLKYEKEWREMDMAMTEVNSLDMSAVLLHAYDVGDLINASTEVADYLYWKKKMEQDEEVQKLVCLFIQKKERFEECERFGHFHPDYHAALEEVQRVQDALDRLEPFHKFKEAEFRLDDLLYTVSKTIAEAVSDSIKVPSDIASLAEASGCAGCASGGSCSGKCG